MALRLEELDALSNSERVSILVRFLKRDSERVTTFESLLTLDMSPQDTKLLLQSAKRLDWTTQGLNHALFATDTPAPLNSDIVTGLVYAFGKLWKREETSNALVTWLDSHAAHESRAGGSTLLIQDKAASALHNILVSLGAAQRKLFAKLLAKVPAASDSSRRMQILDELLSYAISAQESPQNIAFYQHLLPACSDAVALDFLSRAGPIKIHYVTSSAWEAFARKHARVLTSYIIDRLQQRRPLPPSASAPIRQFVIPALLQRHDIKVANSEFTIGQDFFLRLVEAHTEPAVTEQQKPRQLSSQTPSLFSFSSDNYESLEQLSSNILSGVGSTRSLRRFHGGYGSKREVTMKAFDAGLSIVSRRLREMQESARSSIHQLSWATSRGSRFDRQNTYKLLEISVYRWHHLVSRGDSRKARDLLSCLSEHMTPTMWSLSRRNTVIHSAMRLVPRDLRWHLVRDLNAPHTSKKSTKISSLDEVDIELLGDQVGRQKPLSCLALVQLDVATARILLTQAQRILGPSALYTCMPRLYSTAISSVPSSSSMRANVSLKKSSEGTIDDILSRALCRLVTLQQEDDEADSWRQTSSNERPDWSVGAQRSIKAHEMIMKAWWLRQGQGDDEERHEVLAYLDKLSKTNSKSEVVRGHTTTVVVLVALALGDVDNFASTWSKLLNSCKRDHIPREMNMASSDSLLSSFALIDSFALFIPMEIGHRCLRSLMTDYLATRRKEPDFVSSEEETRILDFLRSILERRIAFIATTMSEEEAVKRGLSLLNPVKELIVDLECHRLKQEAKANPASYYLARRAEATARPSGLLCPTFLGSWFDSLVVRAEPSSSMVWTWQLILPACGLTNIDLDITAPRLAKCLDETILRLPTSNPAGVRQRDDAMNLRSQWCLGKVQRVKLFLRLWDEAEENPSARRAIVAKVVDNDFLDESKGRQKVIGELFYRAWGRLFLKDHMSFAQLLKVEKIEEAPDDTRDNHSDEVRSEAIGLAKKAFELLAELRNSPHSTGRKRVDLMWEEATSGLSNGMQSRLGFQSVKEKERLHTESKKEAPQNDKLTNDDDFKIDASREGRSGEIREDLRRTPEDVSVHTHYNLAHFINAAQDYLRRGIIRPADVEAILKKVESAAEDESFRDEALPYALALTKLLTVSQEPHRALPRAVRIVKDSALSSYHRQVPFSPKVIRELVRMWSRRWLQTMIQEIDDATNWQEIGVGAENLLLTPNVKVTTFKALVEVLQASDSFSSSEKIQLFLRCMQLSSHVDVVSLCVKGIAELFLTGQETQICQKMLSDLLLRRNLEWLSTNDSTVHRLAPFGKEQCYKAVEDVLASGRSEDWGISYTYLRDIVNPLLESIFQRQLRAQYESLQSLGISSEHLDEGMERCFQVLSVPRRVMSRFMGQEVIAASMSTAGQSHALLKLTELTLASPRFVKERLGRKLRHLVEAQTRNIPQTKEMEIARRHLLQLSRASNRAQIDPLLDALVSALKASQELSETTDQMQRDDEAEGPIMIRQNGLYPLLCVVERVGNDYFECKDDDMIIIWAHRLVNLAPKHVGWDAYKKHLRSIVFQFLRRSEEEQAHSKKNEVYLWRAVTLKLQWLVCIDWALLEDTTPMSVLSNAIFDWVQTLYREFGRCDFIETQQLLISLGLDLDHTQPTSHVATGQRSSVFQHEVLSLGKALLERVKELVEDKHADAKQSRELRHLAGTLVLHWFKRYDLARSAKIYDEKKDLIRFCKAQLDEDEDIAWQLLWSNSLQMKSRDLDEQEEQLEDTNT